MNARTIQATPVDRENSREIEIATTDLARLARAAVIVAERVCDDPSVVEEIADADADVLKDLLHQIDEIARALRIACRPA